MSVNETRDRLIQEWSTLGHVVYRDDYVVRIQTSGFCCVFAVGSLVGVEDQIIQREIALHREMERSFEWTAMEHDQPSDLLSRLVDFGFEVGEKEVTLVLDLESFPIPESLLEVRKVIDEKGLADFRAVAEEVFGKDFAYTTGVLRESMTNGDGVETGFITYDDGRPVSVGRLSVVPGATFGGLYTGGTLPGSRGHGFYQANVWARARVARQRGLRYLSVDAKPSSLPILCRLGFVPILEQWPCTYTI